MEHLNEYSYVAKLARLDFDCTVLMDSFHLSWVGFNERMSCFVIEVIDKIWGMKSRDLEKTFNMAKENLLQDWQNLYLE